MRNHRSSMLGGVALVALAATVLLGCSAESADEVSRHPPTASGGAAQREMVSQFQVYFPGLDEVVTHVFYEGPAGFLHKRSLRANGSPAALAEILELERLAYTARFGRMTYALAMRLETCADDEQIDVGVIYDPGADEAAISALTEELVSEEQARLDAVRGGRMAVDAEGVMRATGAGASALVARLQGRAALERTRDRLLSDAVVARGIELSQKLAANGYSVGKPPTGTPVLSVRARATTVRALAAEPGVSWVLLADDAPGAEQAAPNGMSFHKIDTGMNAAPNNLDGTGQKVGLLENVKCAIHDLHEAFSSAPNTVYSPFVAAQNCSDDSGCSSLCMTAAGDTPGICTTVKGSGTQKKCVDPHLSQVASGIWGKKGGTGYGAFRATPYVWLGSVGATNTACQPLQTAAAFDWLQTNTVRTVVASYGCPSNTDDGFVEDWNAARRDMAIFKATPGGTEERTEFGCRPANALCVGGMTTQNNPIDAWRNPRASGFTYYLDREEPDVVAFAGNSDGTGVEVMRVPTTNQWIQEFGTSFANPLVAAMAVLAKQKCGGTLDPRFVRALIMASAWYYDPESSAEGGLAFSTQPKYNQLGNPLNPGMIKDFNPDPYGKDYKDGAGGPTGDNVLRWCGGGGGGITVDGGPFTLTTTGGSPFTPPTGVGGPYNLAPGALEEQEEGVASPLSYDATNLKTAWSRIYSFAADTRVRAVLVWDKCTPTSASGPGSGPYNFQNPTEDFDLFLCKADNSSCVGLSRSVYDNKEGFDVTVATAGDYRLSVVYDADASLGCNGSFTVASAFALAYGSPSSLFVEAP